MEQRLIHPCLEPQFLTFLSLNICGDLANAASFSYLTSTLMATVALQTIVILFKTWYYVLWQSPLPHRVG